MRVFFSINTVFRHMAKVFADVIFPPKCLKCGSFLIDAQKSDIISAEKSDIISAEKDDIISAEKDDIISAGKDDIISAERTYGLETRSEFMDIESAFSHFSRYFCPLCCVKTGDLSIFMKHNEDLSSTDVPTDLSTDRSSIIPAFSKFAGIDSTPLSGIEIEVRASSIYDGVVKESIHLFKYSGKTGLADPLGLLLFQTFARYYENKPIDFIVPIPLYRWKMMQRGFNQSFLLVRKFRKYWLQWKGFEPSWKVAPELIVRKRNTKSQTGFSRQERQENLRGAFAVNKPAIVKGRHIVLVDDVHTTGATTTEAGKVLFEAGAASVGVIVIAKA
ncbi:MAG: ComF family protein [Desulfamplus sp.]|nr:ComF family protein [Desulfamplus sp.]